MTPKSNGNPQQQETDQPDPSPAPGDDSSEEVKISRKEYEQLKSYEGRIPDLQRTLKQLEKRVTPQQEQDTTRKLLERAHALGAEDKPLDEVLNIIQSEQTEQQFRENVALIAQTLRSGGALPIGPGKTEGVDMAAVLADYSLDPTDTFVAARLQGKQFDTLEEAQLYAGQILRDKSKAPKPNSAQQPTTPSTSAQAQAEPEEYEAIAARLTTAMKNPKQNRELIKTLSGQLKELEAQQ